MATRIKIKLSCNGHVWCYPSEVGLIKELNEVVTVVIKGKWFGVQGETAEELIARLDEAK